MTKRTLKDGRVIEDSEEVILLTVKTRVPEKYTLIDNETGQVYTGDRSGVWKKVKK